MDDPKTIINAYLDDELTEDQLRELSAWMHRTPDNRKRFVTECYLHSQLQDIFAGEKIVREAAGPVIAESMGDAQASAGYVAFVGNAWHGTIGFFSQEIPFSLLIATVITGLGLLAGSMVYVSRPQPIAHDSRQLRPMIVETKPVREYIGRISAMVDVKWEEGSELKGRDARIEKQKSLVVLGDTLSLTSGLMEITYNTGAKVILEGPVTYTVDSRDGGFLAVGKLTARLEKKGEVGRRKVDETVNPKSLLPSLSTIHYPLFTIKTPTATVTDLGTEFGVEVDDKKVCHVETFVGLVNVTPTNARTADSSRPLSAGEAVSVDAAGVIVKKRSAASHFVRIIPQSEPAPYMKAVLEDRPLAYWPLNESPTVSWILDRSGHGCDGHFVGNVRLVRGGPFDDNRRRSAEFSGNGYIQVSQLPQSDAKKGFTIELWTKTDANNGQGTYRSPLCYRDDRGESNRTGFMFYATAENIWRFQTGTGVFWAGIDGPAVVPEQWVYLAGTFKPTLPEKDGVFQGVLKFYVNGVLAATEQCPWKPNDTMPLRIGAGMSELATAGHFYIGCIAEVAVYDRPLDENRIRMHWEIGRPTDAAVSLPGKGTSSKNKTP